jgi:hypothetical protein
MMMSAPQYSLRRLLALVALCAVACLIVAAATRGHVWAMAVVIALLGFVVTMLVQALLFVLAGGLGVLLTRHAARRKTAERSI